MSAPDYVKTCYLVGVLDVSGPVPRLKSVDVVSKNPEMRTQPPSEHAVTLHRCTAKTYAEAANEMDHQIQTLPYLAWTRRWLPVIVSLALFLSACASPLEAPGAAPFIDPQFTPAQAASIDTSVSRWAEACAVDRATLFANVRGVRYLTASMLGGTSLQPDGSQIVWLNPERPAADGEPEIFDAAAAYYLGLAALGVSYSMPPTFGSKPEYLCK